MKRVPLSFFRRLTLHLWRDVSRDPTIFGVCELDSSRVKTVIDDVRAGGGPKITLLHAAALALARSYRRYPELNSKVVGKKVLQLDSVDITFPVTLSPQQPGDLEILFAKVNDVDRMTLPEVAVAFADASTRARELAQRPLTRLVDRAGRLLPDALIGLGMSHGWELFKRVDFSKVGLRHHPFGSTTISNIGAIRPIEGLTGLTTMALIIPMGYTSSYLLGPATDKPVVEHGAIVVRPIVPLTYGIDHRVCDGFNFVRYVDYWTRCFREPSRFLMGHDDPHAENA